MSGTELKQRLAAILAAPNAAITHSNLCLVAVGAGDIETAKTAFAAVRRLAPEMAQSRLDGKSAYHRLEDKQRVLLAWRIGAGLEDPGAAEALR